MGAVLGVMLTSALLQTAIPCLDLNTYLHGNPEEKDHFVEQFGLAMEKVGCAAIQNSGISDDLIERALAESKQYFKLQQDIKMQAYTGNGLQGYVPFGQEHAKNYPIGDLKEYYHLSGSSMEEKLFPNMRPEFKKTMIPFYDACDTLVRHLLVATGRYLRCEDEKMLANLLGEGNNILRILHYPVVDPQSKKAGAVRSHEHEDINLITIMPKASAPGLQIKTKEDEWIDVLVPDHTIIVTPSEVLGHITCQKIRATTHRVINPPDGDFSERYAFPFFASPHLDTMIPILDVETGKVKETIAHSKLLAVRYKEIGVSK
jgi:isopenicillin N synthase-like dioxygenase